MLNVTRGTERQDTTNGDSRFCLTVDEVARQYEQAGVPRSIRTLQRYCARGNLDCIKVPTQLGDVYLVAPDSVARHTEELRQVLAATDFTTRRGEARQTTTTGAVAFGQTSSSGSASPGPDMSRQIAADDTLASRYVGLLEDENAFLREQVGTKDAQIRELSERSRETNHLIAGLQKMLTPLLGGGREMPVQPREDFLNSPASIQ